MLGAPVAGGPGQEGGPGRLRARKVGTQHVLDERDLAEFLGEPAETDLLPPEWQRTFWGGPMPDFVGIIRRQRSEH